MEWENLSEKEIRKNKRKRREELREEHKDIHDAPAVTSTPQQEEAAPDLFNSFYAE